MKAEKTGRKNGKGRKISYSGERESLRKELELATADPCKSNTFKVAKKFFRGFDPK